MNISTKLVKAFNDDPELGNPAGVILDASALPDEQMQSIASELNFSESAFVLPSKVADYRTRFFTVSREVDYCGHATLATYYELFNLPENRTKNILTQEARTGAFSIEKAPDGKIMMTQKDPIFGEIEEDRELVCRLLGIREVDLDSLLPIQVVKTNVHELIVPCGSAATLKSVKPDLQGIISFVKDKPYHGIYCFAQSDTADNDLVARSFAPVVGIDEDAATGVAAGPLACYAYRYIYKQQKKRIKINQGMWMGKSSDIFVDLTDRVRVGGYAAEFGERSSYDSI